MTDERDSHNVIPPEPGPDSAVGSTSAAEATTGASVFSGGLWHLSSLVLPQAYAVLISVVAARVLGPTGMGQQSFISFVAVSAAMVFTGGLPRALMRYIGEASGRDESHVVGGLVRWAWRVELGAALLGGVIVAGIGLTRGSLRNAWLLAAFAVAMATLHTVPSSVLIGLQRWRQATIVGLVTGAAGMVATVAVLVAGGGIIGMFAVEASVSLVNLLWSGRLAKRVLEDRTHEAPAGFRPDKAVGRYAVIATVDTLLTLIVWRRSEFLFLERYSSPDKVALYSISFSAVAAVGRFPEALVAVLVPAFATLLGAGQTARISSGFSRAARLVTQVAFPLTALMLALGPSMLVLVYGEQYRGTGVVLVTMMVFFPVIPLVKLGNALMAGLARPMVPLLAAAAAAVVNVSLDFALVPSRGPVGAAIANGLAQVTAGVPVIMIARRLTGARFDLPRLLGTVVASALAGLFAGWVSGALGGLVGLAAGFALFLVMYLGLVFGLRLLSTGDLLWLEATLGSKMGGRIGPLLRRLHRLGRR